jgi:hypothetical protein
MISKKYQLDDVGPLQDCEELCLLHRTDEQLNYDDTGIHIINVKLEGHRYQILITV